MSSPKEKAALSLHAVVCSMLLAGCTAAPLERPEAQELVGMPRLTRAVCVRVDSSDETSERFGTSGEWAAELVRQLRENLNTASAVWTPEERREEEADLLVAIHLRSRQPAEPEVDVQGAFLNFLTWSNLPLIPWWIGDVDVDPALDLRVTLRLVRHDLERDWHLARLGAEQVLPVPLVQTSLRDRYPLLSWATLGALLLPPFVFQEGDTDHMAEMLRERVRAEAALEVARVVKSSDLADGELLRNLELIAGPEGPALVYEAAPELREVEVWLDRGAPDRGEPLRDAVPLGESRLVTRRLSLKELAVDANGEERLLRVEAIGADGRGLRYSVALDDEARAAFRPGGM